MRTVIVGGLSKFTAYILIRDAGAKGTVKRFIWPAKIKCVKEVQLLRYFGYCGIICGPDDFMKEEGMRWIQPELNGITTVILPSLKFGIGRSCEIFARVQIRTPPSEARR
jgi:hypothetical protein